MTAEERYQETVEGIALARRTVEQTAATIRQAMDNGDDPVIFLHNLSVALGKESPFQAGGQGAAIYTVACFLLAESGFFDPREPVCICPRPEGRENRAPTEYLATCPFHRGSWAETLAILADRELTAQLTASIEDLGDLEANFVDAEEIRATVEARHAVEDVAIAEEMLPAGAEVLGATETWCSGYCAEVPILVGFHDPRCSEYVEPVAYCEDPDCLIAECDGDHDPLRCPTTSVVRGNIATVNGKWLCCDGDYPNHAEPKTCGDPYCGKPGCDGTVLHEPDRYIDGGA